MAFVPRGGGRHAAATTPRRLPGAEKVRADHRAARGGGEASLLWRGLRNARQAGGSSLLLLLALASVASAVDAQDVVFSVASVLGAGLEDTGARMAPSTHSHAATLVRHTAAQPV